MAYPKPSGCATCPLYRKGRGFVLGVGDPKTAKLAFCGEGAGATEIETILDPKDDYSGIFNQQELARRREAYPDIPTEILRRGVPFSGTAGGILNGWEFKPVGIKRHEVFIDNVLRCFPPKYGDSNYPTGKDRKEAEKCCRQYDRWDQFNPELVVVTLHPAAIARETSPLPLVSHPERSDFRKAKDFAAQGHKTLVALGGKAAKMWVPYAESITKWRGEYKWLR